MKLARILLVISLIVGIMTDPTKGTLGVFELLDLRKVLHEPFLSSYEANPQLYRYQYNRTTRVAMTTTTSLSNNCELWMYPLSELNTALRKHYILAIESCVDYRGNYRVGFGNKEIKHQPLFVLQQDATTGKATSVKISKALSFSYLEVAVRIVEQFAPNIKADMDQVLLSTETVSKLDNSEEYERLTVINLSDAPVNGQEGEGFRKISIDSTGLIRSSTDLYSVQTKSLKTSDPKGNSFGDATPILKVEIEDTFVLAKTEVADSSLIKQATLLLDQDGSVESYSSEAFTVMVTDLREKVKQQLESNAAEDKPDIQKQLASVNQDTSEGDRLQARDERTTHPVLTRNETLIRTPIFNNMLLLYLLTEAKMIIVDKNPASDFNRININVTVRMEYGSMFLDIPVFLRDDWVIPGYTNQPANKNGSWQFNVPIKFQDRRINFDLQINMEYTVTSINSLQKIGNQLTLNRTVNVSVSCSASLGTPNMGGIIGQAELKGTVINVVTSQLSTIVLDKSNIGITNTLKTMLNPCRYTYGQHFQTYYCKKSSRRAPFWKKIWCDWRAVQYFNGGTSKPTFFEIKFEGKIVIV